MSRSTAASGSGVGPRHLRQRPECAPRLRHRARGGASARATTRATLLVFLVVASSRLPGRGPCGRRFWRSPCSPRSSRSRSTPVTASDGAAGSSSRSSSSGETSRICVPRRAIVSAVGVLELASPAAAPARRGLRPGTVAGTARRPRTAPSRPSATTTCCSSTRPSRTFVGEWARPGLSGRASRSGSCCSRRSSSCSPAGAASRSPSSSCSRSRRRALQAIRGIYWFSIACLIILPPAIDRALGFREPPPLRSVGRVVSLLAVTGLRRRYRRRALDWGPCRGQLARRRSCACARRTPRPRNAGLPNRPLCRLAALDDSRAPGPNGIRHRFEVYTRAQMVANVHFNGETGKDWKRVADGYRIITLDNTDETSHLADLLAEPGARVSIATRRSRSSTADPPIEWYLAGRKAADRPPGAVDTTGPNVQYGLDRRAVPKTAGNPHCMSAPTPPG